MKTTVENCLHLNVEIVNEIHEEAIAQFGGINGIRDQALLESAIAATQASFGGVSPFTDAIDVAGAYLYYLCSNHPYLDGNKRVGLGACLVFLQLNGFTPAPDGDAWETLTLAVAAGVLAREEVTENLRALVQ
jgi:death on curing protein